MIFPLAASVPTVVIDGKVVRSYVAVRLVRGHIFAPVEPFVTSVATRIAYDGEGMTIYRADRFAQVRVRSRRDPADLDKTFVELAPVLRALGERIEYDRKRQWVVVSSPHGALATPTPFNPAVPQAGPTSVFTPTPVSTPRPVFPGRPVPRRTPLPVATPGGF
ncbi:MAG: hypothetical protein M3Y18_05410 [Candidatus Eremiobacteraeota bacterium]|nr:hypothetical protein [Candidatus Eremiobacteraeota bacterium]